MKQNKKNDTFFDDFTNDKKRNIEPIVSYGIILVKIIGVDMKTLRHSNEILLKYKNNGVAIKDKEEYKIVSEYINKIKILMVMRKHSLGFAEFMRGKYCVTDGNGIRGLFSQMIDSELEMINTKSFDELWNIFWDTNKQNISCLNNEYIRAKEKFMTLKNSENIESSLSFYIKNTVPLYKTPEWGFPKGRKQNNEDKLVCALREFYEETGLSKDDINIIDNIKILKEDLIGTNGKKYRHEYFIAESITDKIPYVDINNDMQRTEIGDIGYFSYTEALDLIRDYHIEKREILKNIINHYIETCKNMKKEITKWDFSYDDL